MSNIPKKTSERFAKEVGKFKRVLKKALDRDINESDTVSIINDILEDVFGFDKYEEITSEYCIRNTYCDLAIRVDGKIEYLIEAKAIGSNLKENHLRQAVQYGATSGIPWVVLTNGIDWEIYRIIFEQPVRSELVCEINFLELSARKNEDQEKLFLLCREGIVKNAMDAFHERVQSVNRFVNGSALRSEDVLKVVRRDLRKMTPGLKIDLEEIEEMITTEVLKRDVVDGEEAKKATSRYKRAMNKAAKK